MHGAVTVRRAAGAALILAAALAAQAGERDFAYFAGTLADLDRLPVLEPGVTCKQFSSYDRASRYDAKTDTYVNWGANGDSGHYMRTEASGEAVMAEMDGPGCIVRIWSANPTGKIRFYLDGAQKPTFEWNFADLFHNKVPPFVPPVAGMDGRGANTFLPIPYARSCKVAADKAHRQYYHIGYKTFPKSTQVKTLRLPLTDAETQALQKAIATLTHPEPDWDGRVNETELPVGKPVVLAEEKGPKTVVRFYAKLESEERYPLRRVLLRIFWDGEERPSVECPLGDFFGTGYLANRYTSLPLDVQDGGVCRWRMPFRKAARIVAVNEGTKPAKLEHAVAFRPGDLTPTTAYFHAKWRREDPCKTFDYPILETSGAAGRFLGCCLSVDNPGTGWWGEGDEKVYVDGEKFPSTFGTGSEDYFGDAWGFRHFVHPFHGCTLGQGPGFSNKWSVYRWHISDDIPFEKSFRITIENYGRDKDYNSVAYWYQLHPQKDFFTSVPVKERVPRPRAIPGVVEAESIEIADAVVIDDEGRLDELSRGKAVVLKGGAGKVFELPVSVPADDVYGVVLYGAKGEAHAPFEVSAGETVVGKGAEAFAQSALLRLGKVRLAKGEARLALKLTGEGSLALDAFRLEPSRKVRGVIEGESLQVKATEGPKAQVEDVRLPWSGDSQLLLPAAAKGQSVTVAIPVKAPGRYQLSVRLTRGPDCGRVQVSRKGAALGEPVDCFAPKAGVGANVPLGIVELTREDPTLRFQVVSKSEKATGYHVGIDYLRLNHILVEDAIEAERLPRVAVEGGPVGPQAMGGWGGHNWSGNTQLFFRPDAKGAFVTLQATAPRAGRYALAVYYTKAIDYGIVQLHVDGKAVGKPFDGFNNGVVPSGKVDYGTIELAAGKHPLKFQVAGKNEAATGYYVGIDCVTLTPAK